MHDQFMEAEKVCLEGSRGARKGRERRRSGREKEEVRGKEGEVEEMALIKGACCL